MSIKFKPLSKERVEKLFSEPIHKDPMHVFNPTKKQKEFLKAEPIKFRQEIPEYPPLINVPDTVFIKAIEENVVETQNEFFFRAVSPWVDRQVKIHVPKKTLLEAVLEFSRNHPEEWRQAINQCGFEDTDNEKD